MVWFPIFFFFANYYDYFRLSLEPRNATKHNGNGLSLLRFHLWRLVDLRELLLNRLPNLAAHSSPVHYLLD